MDIKRLAVALAFAAVAHIGGIGWAQAEYTGDIQDDIPAILDRLTGPEGPLPPDLGDPHLYEQVLNLLPMLLATHEDFETPEQLLEYLMALSGVRSDGRLCPVDVDGQKFRVAGGKFIIAGGELPFSPVDLSDPDGDGKPGPFWTVEPSPLILQIDRGTPIHLVILDDFEFSLLGEIAQFPADGIGSGLGPHGHLVLYHSLLSMGADLSGLPQQFAWVEEAGPFSQMPIQWTQMSLGLHSGGSATVTMIDVNFQDPLVRVADAVAFANSRFGDAPNVAFNASWNLVPCALTEAYETTDLDFASFGHFLWHLVTQQIDDPGVTQLFEAYRQITDQDVDRDASQRELDAFEFRLILATNASIASAVASLFDTSNAWFASAGNLSLGFALPPASFQNVIAVGACHLTRVQRGDTLQLELASWSNLGEQHTFGAWFRGDLGHNPMAAPYAGTSFASPIAAIAYSAGTANRLVDCTP